MQSWQVMIISLAVGSFGSMGAWSLLNTIAHGRAITKIETRLETFEKSVALLNQTFEDFSLKMENLGKRFDLFVKNELVELKEVLKKQ